MAFLIFGRGGQNKARPPVKPIPKLVKIYLPFARSKIGYFQDYELENQTCRDFWRSGVWVGWRGPLFAFLAIFDRNRPGRAYFRHVIGTQGGSLDT